MKAVNLAMVALVLFVGAGILSADIVFTATEDAYVQAGQYADNNYGNLRFLFVKNSWNTGEPQYTRKAYIKFDISSLSQPVASAELSLVVCGYINESIIPYSDFVIWGLTDESQDSWSESTITWNNAPANIDAGWEFDGTKAVQLGAFRIYSADYAAGDVITFSSPEMVNFINSDTNGQITLMISITNESEKENSPLIASKEHETYPGPRLTIVPIPEPASIGLLLLGLGLVRRR